MVITLAKTKEKSHSLNIFAVTRSTTSFSEKKKKKKKKQNKTKDNLGFFDSLR